MSLINLKKSKSLAKPKLRFVEDLIDDALLYDQGKVNKQQTSAAKNKLKKVCTDWAVPIKRAKPEGMRHITFTLTPQYIEKLATIAQKTGKTKSALNREWIDKNSQN